MLKGTSSVPKCFWVECYSLIFLFQIYFIVINISIQWRIYVKWRPWRSLKMRPPTSLVSFSSLY